MYNKLLVVDDDEMSGKLMCKRLVKRGYEAELVTDPREVVKVVKAFKPSLLLLDIVMPYITGIELLELIRKDYRSSELPVVMMTGKTGDEQIVEAMKLGANDYITKPINIEIAMARIDSLLEMLKVNVCALHLREVETLHAMVTTFNHELNNPLAIAMGYLSKDFKFLKESDIEKVNEAILRISEIVNKIDELTETKNKITHKHYASGVNMIDLD